ncbi:hypothetical protein Hte_008097 [Hypoxylon texense]
MTPNPPKPICVWATPPGPNSWKVASLLEELGLNYEIKSFRFDDVKKSPFININPNGRVRAPSMYQYIIEQYDTEKRLTYGTLKEKNLCNQWLHFQMSGRGPYYGQASWFIHLHPDKIPSAIERYSSEVRRILGVLETALAAKPADAQWLVGDKMTFADMSFLPWNFRLSEMLVQSWDEVWEGAPHVRAWHERMADLPSWKRSMEIRTRLMDEQVLQWNGVPKGIETFTEYEAKIAAGEDTHSVEQ